MYLCEKNKIMDQLPGDPAMLLGFLNMKLRDYYADLDELCDDMHLDKEELLSRMNEAGWDYSEKNKKFW